MTGAGSLDERFASFGKDVSRLLASRPPEPRKCSKAAFKSCIVYMGRPSPEIHRRLRGEAQWPSFIMMIHPPECGEEARRLKSSLPPFERTLFAPVSPDGSHAELAGLLLASAKAVSVKFSVEKEAGDAFADEALRVSGSIKDAIHFVNMESVASLLKLREAICNLPAIFSAKSCRISMAEGQPLPAVVCGAGPSLQDDFETLKLFRDRIAIIAAGHAGRKLMKAGIVPDLMVEVDQMCGVNHRGGESAPCPLAALNDVDPSVPPLFEKVVWLEGDSFAFSSLSSVCGLAFSKAAVSYSVIVTAIDLALKLGFKSLSLSGNDLCLSGDGLSHVGERTLQDDETEYVEASGNDGSGLVSTSDFMEIKRRIEKHARLAMDSGDILKFVNSTARGVAISGLAWEPLRAFCESSCHATGETGFNLSASVQPHGSLERLKDSAASLSLWRQNLSESAGVVWRLTRELNNSNPEMRRIQELRAKLSALLEENDRLMNSPSASPVARLVEAQASDFFDDAAEAPQISNLKGRFEFMKNLVNDFEMDLKAAIEAIEAGRTGIESDPFKFDAFNKFAISFIVQSNRELASRIETGGFGKATDSFELKPNWLDLPMVWRRMPDGSRHALSGNLSMHSKARQGVEAFIRDNSFDPAKDAVAFLAPGNWADVAAFARLHPDGDLKCMVLDPWPELLCELLPRSMFLHMLPPRTPVVAIHDSLRNWRRIYSDTLREWREAGRRTLFYRCPGPWALQEVRDVFKDIAP